MKKACIILALLVIAGCSAITFNTQEQIALQIVAQRAGYYVAKNNPSIVPQVKLVAEGILASRNADIAKAGMEMAILELAKQFPNDPLLEADLKLIASALKLDIPNAKLDLSQVIPVIQAFINGLEIGAKQ